VSIVTPSAPANCLCAIYTGRPVRAGSSATSNAINRVASQKWFAGMIAYKRLSFSLTRYLHEGEARGHCPGQPVSMLAVQSS
jgi:hypothetical protein